MTSDKLSTFFETKQPGTAEILPLLQELLDKRDWPSVENMARKAAELRPDQQEFHLILGWALHNQGKARAAEQAYGACLRLNPQNVQALVNLGNLQISGGQPAAGIKALDGALYLDPGNLSAQLHKCRGLGLLEKPDEALKILDKLALEHPDNIEVVKAQILACSQIGHMTRVNELLARAAEIAPYDPTIAGLVNKAAH